jgi:hypothetical protein
MIGAAIYLGHQGIVMRRANKIIAGVVKTLTETPPTASFDAMAAAGDLLAHQLLHRDHPLLLDRWWELRGGHDRCTVCNPGEERPR